MKALIIASLVFFSLRAMSATVGEDQKSECAAASQTNKREAKVVEQSTEEVKVEGSKNLEK